MIWRYTYGYNRKEHELSSNFIANATGIGLKSVKSELKNLIEANVIRVEKEATFSSSRVLSFNKYSNEWSIGGGEDSYPRGSEEPQGNDTSPGEGEYTTPGEDSYPTPGEDSYPQQRQERKKDKGPEKNDKEIIKDHRRRYSNEQLRIIDEYFDILRWTRKNGRIADSVIKKIYQEWEKFPVDHVIYALMVYINNPGYHDKKENYCYGIMRNATADEVQNYLNKNFRNSSSDPDQDKASKIPKNTSKKLRKEGVVSSEEIEKLMEERKKLAKGGDSSE